VNTPTPTHSAIRGDVAELLNALPSAQGRAVRGAIMREVLALFDSATATPEPRKDAPAYVPTQQLPMPVSDTNGSEPEAVEREIERSFHPPAAAELLVMQSSVPNGIDPEERP
jgi:hypothetical protein